MDSGERERTVGQAVACGMDRKRSTLAALSRVQEARAETSLSRAAHPAHRRARSGAGRCESAAGLDGETPRSVDAWDGFLARLLVRAEFRTELHALTAVDDARLQHGFHSLGDHGSAATTRGPGPWQPDRKGAAPRCGLVLRTRRPVHAAGRQGWPSRDFYPWEGACGWLADRIIWVQPKETHP